jgi:site-specific recombinase XerD
MLTMFFKAPHTLRRLSAGSAGQFMDDYAGRLHDAGYTGEAAREHLRTAAHLTQWLDRHGVRLSQWDEAALEQFWKHLDACLCGRVNDGGFPNAVAAARRYLGYLREIGAVRTRAQAARRQKFGLLDEFRSWLKQHRGASDATIKAYSPQVADYLHAVGGRAHRITATTLRDFVLRRAARAGRNRGRCAATALRTFVRFLVCVGRVSPGIDSAIPAIRKWRLSALPPYLSVGEVDRVVAACDDSSPIGVRDRAIILLLARLGLRAGDVAALQLQSLDFATASVRVAGKGRREVRLPLTQEVGKALARYVTVARPKVMSDRLFIRVEAPVGPLTSRGVTGIAASAIRRAGVRTARLGAHVLRYSAATSMMREGASLEQIGAVLRHSSRDITAHYAKIDVDLLRSVAQPWPEVQPC